MNGYKFSSPSDGHQVTLSNQITIKRMSLSLTFATWLHNPGAGGVLAEFLHKQVVICRQHERHREQIWNRTRDWHWTITSILIPYWIRRQTNKWNGLTHLPLDKMAAISQTIFSDAFSWMKSFLFWLKFHWSLFLRVQLTVIQHWFR